MRSLIFVIASFAVTILCWGIYGPVLHAGQAGMSTVPGEFARLRPFICVGLAYFLIGVLVPAIWLKLRGEPGDWTMTGIIWSLAGGALGAIGALGIIMAFNFGGKPQYVMPLVFGGAPVVNSFLTIYLARKLKEIGPLFMAGLVMVLIGAVTVLIFAPRKEKPHAATSAETASAAADVDSAAAPEKPTAIERAKEGASNFVLQILSILTVVACWGAYGPVLHKGQAAMHHSRMRPLICVGLAYFAIAVILPNLMLAASSTGEASEWNFSGTLWSLAGGAAGAIGALGIIMAFNFGGKPTYVMPLVFGGAPVVNTLTTTIAGGLWDKITPWFLAGLILVVAGAAMVLVFAPRGAPPKPAKPVPPPAEPSDVKPAEKKALVEEKAATENDKPE
ncbi:MAG: hypothetical protein CMJ58_08040 [Planctomycetaceae bacterium]|nr:hypothetical protein [Planctomycetaceae bacterium]